MNNKKWEQLIDLVINEDNEKASQLFHEIIVETSRHVYENMMDEEMMGMEEGMDMEEDMDMEEGGMGGQVGDLLDEINAEESGMTEGEEETETFDLSGEEEMEPEMDDDMMDHGSEEHEEHGEIDSKLDKIEDKLDQLMSEFEEIMGKDGGEEEEEEEEEEEVTEASEEDEEDAIEEAKEEDEEDMDESVMENVNLPKVPGVKHGDDGANAKSPTLHEPRVKAEGVKPVKYNQGGDEAVPTSPKKPSNAYSKGEGNLPGAGNFANTPGKNNFAIKGQSAPKPKHGDDGSNKKSPVATK